MMDKESLQKTLSDPETQMRMLYAQELEAKDKEIRRLKTELAAATALVNSACPDNQRLRASLRECVRQLKFLNSGDVKASTNVVLVSAIKVLDGQTG
jgi:hypothetical protein